MNIEVAGPLASSLADLQRVGKTKQLIEIANSLSYLGVNSMAVDGSPDSAGSTLARLLNRTGVKHEVLPQANDRCALLATVCVVDTVALVPQVVIDERVLIDQTVLARVDIAHNGANVMMAVAASSRQV